MICGDANMSLIRINPRPMPNRLAARGGTALACAVTITESAMTRKTIVPVLILCLTGTSALAQQMPEAMRGEWATSAANCTDPHSDERIRISADGITFYEWKGILSSLSLSEPHRISGRFDFAYAEDEWTQDIGLAVAPDGSVLVIQHPEQEPVRMVPCR